MKCYECGKEMNVEIREVKISVRKPSKELDFEVVVRDDICLNCLLKALEMEV